MDPLVIDDFLPIEFQDSIVRMLTEHEFPWNFFPYSVSEKEYPLDEHYHIDSPFKEHIQFRHVFASEGKIVSPFFEYIAPLIGEYQQLLGEKDTYLQRIKANLLMPQSGPKTQQPHTDGMRLIDGVYNSIGRKTLLYYVNDSDGDTILYDKYFLGEPLGLVKEHQRISPKKGRAVIFDSNQIHGGTCPTDSDYRMVINCVFN
jgi:hypothetical protein